MLKEYILKNIPAYERANEQLNQQSKRWQAELEELALEAETLFKKYQSESAFLSDEQRVEREEEILAKEKEASELKRTYFGPAGELYKKRESLMAPIQEEVYNAIREQINATNRKLVGYKRIMALEFMESEFEKTPSRKIKRFLYK